MIEGPLPSRVEIEGHQTRDADGRGTRSANGKGGLYRVALDPGLCPSVQRMTRSRVRFDTCAGRKADLPGRMGSLYIERCVFYNKEIR